MAKFFSTLAVFAGAAIFQFGMRESQPAAAHGLAQDELDPESELALDTFFFPHQLPPTVASICIMKSATEAASFSQPPSNASLMTPSDYRLWQLSLNSGQAARSQANEEVEEAWGYVASGAGE